MIKLYVNLTRLKGAYIAGEILFLYVSLRVQKKLEFKMTNEDHPFSCESGWILTNLLRTQIEKKKKSRGSLNLLSFPDLGHLSSPVLEHWSSWFLGLRTLQLMTIDPTTLPTSDP